MCTKNFWVLGFFVASALLFPIVANSQNIQIGFAATGESNIVETVLVQNLTQQTSLTLDGSGILHLVGIVGIEDVPSVDGELLKVYPNPTRDNLDIEFYSKTNQEVTVELFDISGKKLSSWRQFCTQGMHQFVATNLPAGVFHLTFITTEGVFATKVLSMGRSSRQPIIQYAGTSLKQLSVKNVKNTNNLVQMQYNEGDRLLLKATTGIYSTVKSIVPQENTQLVFHFIEATDADGNNYPIVIIGSQIWLAENLKTTKFNDGTQLPFVPNAETWITLTMGAYSWFQNSSSNMNLYGGYYNWYAVNDTANDRKLCPSGWRVPSDSDWGVLTDFLSPKIAGQKTSVADKLKSSEPGFWNSGWDANNESGFTSLPGGLRNALSFYQGAFIAEKYIAGYWSSTHYGFSTIGEQNYECSMYFEISGANYPNRSFSTINNGLNIRCIYEFSTEIDLPSVTTNGVTSIGSTFASVTSLVHSIGIADYIGRGVVYSTSINPTMGNNVGMVSNNAGIVGEYTCQLSGLIPETTYYVRAYASNSNGTSYGNQLTFTTTATANTGTFTDPRDGNVYRIETIGSQVWMAENLRATKYTNGTNIPTGLSNEQWGSVTQGAYAIYPHTEIYGLDSDAAVLNAYGALYNWYAVETGNLCPLGWRVPTDDDWLTLLGYVITQGYPNSNVVGGAANALKSCRQENSPLGGECTTDNHPRWNDPSGMGSSHYGVDEFNFSALPGGIRDYESGDFNIIGVYGHWWSSSENDDSHAWEHQMIYNSGQMFRGSSIKNKGISVRCVQN